MPATGVVTLMREVTEELIEKYVAYPDSLDEKCRRLVEHTIRINRSARMIADFYRAYYAELRKSGDTPPCSSFNGTDGRAHPDRPSTSSGEKE